MSFKAQLTEYPDCVLQADSARFISILSTPAGVAGLRLLIQPMLCVESALRPRVLKRHN